MLFFKSNRRGDLYKIVLVLVILQLINSIVINC